MIASTGRPARRLSKTVRARRRTVSVELVGVRIYAAPPKTRGSNETADLGRDRGRRQAHEQDTMTHSHGGAFALPGLDVEHLDELTNFAQFIAALVFGDFRRFAEFQHPAAADEPQAADQQFTLTIA